MVLKDNYSTVVAGVLLLINVVLYVYLVASVNRNLRRIVDPETAKWLTRFKAHESSLAVVFVGLPLLGVLLSVYLNKHGYKLSSYIAAVGANIPAIGLAADALYNIREKRE